MAWNAFGALDLVVAVTLAFMSAPGTPYRVFTEGPGTVVMTTLPWILVATFLVPLYLLTHLTIAARLRLSRYANVPRPEAARAQWRTA
jgi:Na+/pantothenate symporter